MVKSGMEDHLYGALTYHELEAVVQATASTSTVPNINIGITNTPINAVGSIQPTANSQFSGFGVTIGATSTNSVAGQRLAIAVPNELTQNSGHLVHATQVDQPETFILVQPTIQSIGTQIDLVANTPINVNSSANVIGTPIDLAESSFSANTVAVLYRHTNRFSRRKSTCNYSNHSSRNSN